MKPTLRRCFLSAATAAWLGSGAILSAQETPRSDEPAQHDQENRNDQDGNVKDDKSQAVRHDDQARADARSDPDGKRIDPDQRDDDHREAVHDDADHHDDDHHDSDRKDGNENRDDPSVPPAR